MKNTKVILIVTILLIVFGGGGFYAGMKYQQSKPPSLRQFNGALGQSGQRNGMGGNRVGFRPVSGEIISSDDKSITVKLNDGSSKIVFLAGNTNINKADQAAKSDLKVGEKVAVIGQENSDGSVTAQNIQLSPIQRSTPN